MRHAQSAGNATGVISGQEALPLTAAGEDAARSASEVVATWPVTRVVASELERAWHTAMLLTGGRAVLRDARLNERGAGRWEGRPRDELEAAHPGALEDDRFREEAGFEPEAGVAARCLAVLTEYAACDGVTLMVGHSGAIRAVLRALHGADGVVRLGNLDAVVLDARLVPVAVLSLATP